MSSPLLSSATWLVPVTLRLLFIAHISDYEQLPSVLSLYFYSLHNYVICHKRKQGLKKLLINSCDLEIKTCMTYVNNGMLVSLVSRLIACLNIESSWLKTTQPVGSVVSLCCSEFLKLTVLHVVCCPQIAQFVKPRADPYSGTLVRQTCW